MRILSTWMPVALGVCLALAATAGAAEGKDAGGADKLRLTSVADAPDPFSPPVARSVAIDAAFGARPTDAGAGSKANSKSFAIRVSVEIARGGVAVRSLGQEFSISFPAELPASQYHSANTSIDWDGTDSVGDAAPDGTYSYTVQGTLVRYDELGNGKTQEHMVGTSGTLSGTTLLDATPPTLTDLQPDVEFTNDNPPVFSASYSDATSGIDTNSVKVSVNSIDVTAQATVGPASVTYRPAQPLSDGSITWKVAVRDRAGNESTDSVSFTLDTVKPVISDLRPDVEFTNDSTPTFSASYSDPGSGIDVNSVRAFVNGSDVTAQATVGTSNVTYVPAEPLDDGDITWEVQVRDKAGNANSGNISFLLDTVKPLISDLRPDVEFTNDNTPTFSASYSDVGSGIEVSSVSALVNDTDVTTQATVGPSGVTYAPAQPLADGNITWKVVVRDRAGNESTDSISFVLDTVRPAISDLQPDVEFTNDNRPSFSASYSDAGSGIDVNSVQALVSGTDVTAQATVGPAGVAYQPVTALSDGDITWAVNVKDNAGNASSDSISFMLDTVPPQIRDLSPATGSLIREPRPTFSAVFSDDRSGVDVGQVVVKLNGADVTAATDVSATGFTYVPAEDLAEGTYTLSVSIKDRAGNPASASTDIEVSLLPPDPSEVASEIDFSVISDVPSTTEFLYTGEDPIQTGVEEGAIEPRRAAVIRGLVKTRDGSPLPGVTITILGHPEFGQTLSREDGMFDMALNGGGQLVVDYEREGYLPVQRHVQVPWQDYVWAPDVVMIPQDTKVSAIDLTTPDFQVAEGSEVTDSDGTRHATVFFPPGTEAYVLLEDGTQQQVDTLHVRLTEFTVGDSGPEAMPAELPPTSFYTYALALTADEAIAKIGGKDVLFNQPVFIYVENFLGFPVGTPVPSAYYDDDKGAWVPVGDGRTIGIVGETGNLAEIDLDGDGVAEGAAALAAAGITDDERRHLASLYEPGQGLWRTPAMHFSYWDKNYGFDTTAEAPEVGEPENYADDKCDECSEHCSPYIEEQDQILGRMLALTGSPFEIYYASDRVPGRLAARTFRIPLSGDMIHPDVLSIGLEVQVAGRLLVKSFSPAANLEHTFTWDGLDAYGRIVQGRQPVTIRIGYVSKAYYRLPASLARSFGLPFGTLSDIRARQDVTLWQTHKAEVSGWDARGQGLGGWTLSIHHAYDPIDKVVHFGDGRRRSARGVAATVIEIVAGFRGDVLSDVTSAYQWWHPQWQPSGIAMGPDGSLYVSDKMNGRVQRIGPGGGTSTIASGLNAPMGLTVAGDGTVYVAEYLGHAVREIAPDGTVTIVAGGNGAGFSGDGEPATDAQLSRPYSVTLSPGGDLYISDTGNNRIRRVSPDSYISTYVGTGETGFSGDGGQAIDAKLNVPLGIAVDTEGNLYVADSRNHRVRRIDIDGVIATVAGTGEPGHSGDGAPAEVARLYRPSGLAVGSDGNLFIGHAFTDATFPDRRGCVRRVRPDGIIYTAAGLAGTATGALGDDVPPGGAILWERPAQVAVAPDGALYIAEYFPDRIRRVKTKLPGLELGGDILIASEDGRAAIYVFSQFGRHLRTLDAVTNRMRYEFIYDASGRLASVTDGDGNVTTIERDEEGNPSAIVAPFGQVTTLETNDEGYLSSAANPAGEAFGLTYHDGGLLATFRNPRGHSESFSYDDRGRLTRAEDAEGGFLAISREDKEDGFTLTVSTPTTTRVREFDSNGKETGRLAPNGAETVHELNVDGLVTRATGPLGFDTVYEYNSLGKVVSMKGPFEPADGVPETGVSYTYDSRGNRTSMTDENGNTTSYGYEADRLISVTTPAGTTSYKYDFMGRRIKETDATGSYTEWHYDERGLLVEISGSAAGGGGCTACGQAAGASGQLGWYTYDDLGRVETYEDLNHHITRYEYDNADRRTKAIDARSYETVYEYDAAGNLLSVEGANGNVMGYVYSPTNRPLSVTNGAGDMTSYTYDLEGRQKTVTDGAGGTWTTHYDSMGRVWKVDAPLGRETTYEYDLLGRQISVTEAEGVVTVYDYDPRGNMVLAIADFGGLDLATQSEHDPGGRLVKTIDPLGHDTEYRYDTANRLAKVISHLGNESVYGYDAVGRQVSVRDGAGRTRFTVYNRAGWVTQVSDGATTTNYCYDEVGNRMCVTVSGRAPVHYFYDDTNNLIRTEQSDDGVTIETSRAVDGVGNVLASTDPEGKVRKYTYDGANRVETVTNPEQETTTYAYDGTGRRTSVAFANGSSRSYGYDVAGQLIGTSGGPEGPLTYAYDDMGRQVSVTDANARTRKTFHDDLGRVVRVENEMSQPVIYRYDDAGRRTELEDANGNVTTYDYDEDNRLIRMTYPAVAGQPPNVEEYAYGGGGLLTSKATPNGDTISYGYSGAGQLASVSFGGRTVGYGRDGAGAVTSIGGQGDVTTISYAYDGLGRMLSATDSALGKTMAYDYDKRGLRTSLTLGDKAIAYTYDAAMRLKTVKKDADAPAVYTYDSGGRRTGLVVPNGVATSYDYDGNDRLLNLATAGPAGTLASFDYSVDAVGNRTGISYTDGSESSYDYDDAYRLTRETRTKDSGTVYEVAFTYDDVGNRLSMTGLNVLACAADVYTSGLHHLDEPAGDDTADDASGNAHPGAVGSGVTFVDSGRFGGAASFDGTSGAEITITDDDDFEFGSGEFSIEANIWIDDEAYLPMVILSKWDDTEGFEERSWMLLVNSDGNLEGKVYSTGTGEASIVSDAALPTDEWVHVAFERDSTGELALYVNGDKQEDSEDFDHALDNTTEDVRIGAQGGGTDGDTFDGKIDEARTSKTARGAADLRKAVVTYTYNARNQLVAETSGSTVRTYSYDQNGNATKIEEKVGATVILAEDMEYDKLNRMTKHAGPRGDESFSYCGAEWHRYSQTSDATKHFLYDGDNVVADIASGGDTFYVTPFLDQNLSMTKDSATYYYSQDGLGSVRTLTDSSGVVKNKYDYTPFGKPFAPGTSVTVKQRYTYTGREKNPASTLMYYRYRQYGPRVGRFGARDPASNVAGGSLYVYASGRATHLTDPLGNWPVKLACGEDRVVRSLEDGNPGFALALEILRPERCKGKGCVPEDVTEIWQMVNLEFQGLDADCKPFYEQHTPAAIDIWPAATEMLGDLHLTPYYDEVCTLRIRTTMIHGYNARGSEYEEEEDRGEINLQFHGDVEKDVLTKREKEVLEDVKKNMRNRSYYFYSYYYRNCDICVKCGLADPGPSYEALNMPGVGYWKRTF